MKTRNEEKRENEVKEYINSLTEDEKKELVKGLVKGLTSKMRKSEELRHIKQSKEKFGFNVFSAGKKAKKLKSNSNFYLFYEELKNYFLHHNMMDLSVEMHELSEGYKFFYYEGNKTVSYESANIKIYDENIFDVTFLPSNDCIELYRIEVYNIGKGVGTILMNAFNEISKKTGIKIKLKLGTPGKKYDETMEVRQRNFYHKNGFKRSKTSEYWYNTEN